MPTYQITAEGLADLRVNCPGCSGDALVLALGHWDIQSYQTLRRLSLIHISEPTRQAEISYAVF